MIAIFKTNVIRKKDARRLLKILSGQFPLSCINFDLQDCDKILRIETEAYMPQHLISVLSEHGFSCVELE